MSQGVFMELQLEKGAAAAVELLEKAGVTASVANGRGGPLVFAEAPGTDNVLSQARTLLDEVENVLEGSGITLTDITLSASVS